MLARAAAGVEVERGCGRRPRRPIVAATVAIWSAVACTRPWPIADEPTARSSPISSAAGIVLVAAPAIAGRPVEAEALGGRDQALARRAWRPAGRTPSCRTSRRPVQRAAARLPVGVLELDALQGRRGLRPGIVRGLATPASSAAVARDDLERRARAAAGPRRRSPRGRAPLRCAARIAAMPPNRPASAVTAASRPGVDRRRTAAPARARGARARGPARSVTAGRAGQPLSKTRSRPEIPTLASAGSRARGALSRCSAGSGRAADDLRRRQRGRGALLALRERRAVAGQQVRAAAWRLSRAGAHRPRVPGREGATLLARDRTVLAKGDDRASASLLAPQVVGQLGPIPPERRDELAALGVPPARRSASGASSGSSTTG